jgi:hypothetical protein
MMKSMLGPAGLAVAATLALAGCSDDTQVADAGKPAPGNGICIPTTMIDHTEILNDSAIVFYMKGDKPYLNTMAFPCPSLKMEDGFAFVANFSEVCSNSQTIKVLRSGNFCELGQFSVYQPPAKQPEAQARY